jgi:hypothetical protein
MDLGQLYSVQPGDGVFYCWQWRVAQIEVYGHCHWRSHRVRLGSEHRHRQQFDHKPSTGVPGIGRVASAGGFTPFETVNLVAFASAPVAIGTATANASGVADVAGHLPQTPFGACGLQAVGQSSGKIASGIISVRASLAVSPNSGEPGNTVTVTGFGFAAGEAIGVEWSNPQTLLGSATANKNGTFSAQFAIPTAAAAGTDEVVARGQRTGAAAIVQITVE